MNVGDSPDVDGQDAEIRLTMPIDDFMEFALIAALEAAAIPHKPHRPSCVDRGGSDCSSRPLAS